MADKKSTDAELAEQFFNHDAKNKRQVAEGYQEAIEHTDDISTIHGYARKIRKTEEEIERMAEEAEEILEKNEKEPVNIQKIIQKSLDNLRCSIEYEETSVGVDWNADNYEAELNPTVEKMLYNLFDNSIEHGQDDIEVEVTEKDDALEISVYDGGDVEEWNNIFPENGETRSDYPSTGAYLIDRVAENNDISILDDEERSYKVVIPR